MHFFRPSCHRREPKDPAVRVVVMLVLLPSLLLLTLALRASAQSVASVVLSEICWMGSEKGTSDEWVELTVTGEAEMDVSGWTLTSLKSDGSHVAIFRFATGSVLPSGSHVIANDSAEVSALLVAPYTVSSSLSLPNTKLHLQLFDAAGTLIDEADDGVGEPMAGRNVSGQPKATMQRVDFSSSGRAPQSWRTSEVSLGFDAESVMLGSPGVVSASVSSSSAERSSSLVSSSASVSFLSSSSSFSSGLSFSSSTSFSSVSTPLIPLVLPLISEILPNPVGSDEQEWVEIFAPALTPLDGYALSDGTRSFSLQGYSVSGALLLPKAVTGLSLANGGGEVRLLRGSEAVDSLSYAAATEGVSVGRLEGDERLFCIPTPGSPNVPISPVMDIRLQSGSLSGQEKVTFNLETVALSGTLQGAQCRVDFGDGDSHEGCNPPSHSIDQTGSYTVTVEVEDLCGNTVVRSVIAQVESEEEESRARATSSSSSKTPASLAPPALRDDIVLVSVLPNPQGDDRIAGEVLTFITLSDAAVALTGFHLSTGKSVIALDDVVVSPKEELHLNLKAYGASLANTEGQVTLLYGDEQASVIAWKDAREGMHYKPAPADGRMHVRVLRVIDGDTIEIVLQSGGRETLRLRGIDAPELATYFRDHQEYSQEAKNYLRSLIEGEKIELQFDTEYQDAYGRMLAYVHTEDGVDVQRKLLELGFARVIPKVDFARRISYEQTEREAKDKKVSLWKHGIDEGVISVAQDAPTDIDDVTGKVEGGGKMDVVLSEIYPSPKKGETEWVELFNEGEDAIFLDGWTLTEEASGKRRTWPLPAGRLLEPGQRFVLHASGSLQLNNGGQDIALRSPAGEVSLLAYPKIASAKSYSRVGDTWCVSSPTPETENLCASSNSSRTLGKVATLDEQVSFLAGLPAYVATVFVPTEEDAKEAEGEPAAASGTALQLEELQTQEWHEQMPPVHSNIPALMTMMFLGVVCGAASIFLYGKVSLRIAEIKKF